jgi:hypothetical protein
MNTMKARNIDEMLKATERPTVPAPPMTCVQEVARARKEQAQLAAEDAVELDWLNERLREFNAHPERAISSEEVKRRYGIKT